MVVLPSRKSVLYKANDLQEAIHATSNITSFIDKKSIETLLSPCLKLSTAICSILEAERECPIDKLSNIEVLIIEIEDLTSTLNDLMAVKYILIELRDVRHYLSLAPKNYQTQN
ncbi:hypothetical protein [Vibrio harveyi]|uniref:hypothetical protein n=1 Tax=Vibrio harveyi TaxID=669 RepID=UPI003CF7EE1E